jgi:hypothetical protein
MRAFRRAGDQEFRDIELPVPHPTSLREATFSRRREKGMLRP